MEIKHAGWYDWDNMPLEHLAKYSLASFHGCPLIEWKAGNSMIARY